MKFTEFCELFEIGSNGLVDIAKYTQSRCFVKHIVFHIFKHFIETSSESLVLELGVD